MNGQFFLPDGQVVVRGPFYDNKNSTLAIIGGTGTYAGVRGYMDLYLRPSPYEFDFHYHMHVPVGEFSTGTITVVEDAITDTVISAGMEADNYGDRLIFINPINGEDFEALDQGQCIRTAVGLAWECEWTAILPDGQISVAGPFFDFTNSTLAIVGGTGIYFGIKGDMELNHLSPVSFEFVYRIIMTPDITTNTGDSTGDNTGETITGEGTVDTGANTGDSTGEQTGEDTGDGTGDNTSDDGSMSTSHTIIFAVWLAVLN